MSLPRGIKPKYDPAVYGSYKPEYDGFAEKLCERGATDKEIADFFDIPRGLLAQWRLENPSFNDAIKIGKEVADQRVERSLYEMAVGTTVEDVKLLADGTEVPYERRIDPNLGAATMWLKNRKRGDWRDKIDHGHEGPNGEALMPPTIVVNLVRKDQ